MRQPSPSHIDDAVRSRMRRQEGLYDSGRRYHILLWEPVLRSLICPPSVLAGQLDRLSGVIGLDTVELGIVPLAVSLRIPPGGGFWIYDDAQVIVENWHAELWLDDTDSVTTHLKVWRTLRESAVFGSDAQALINAARRTLNT